MRIRSIKPEFWSSDDIAQLRWEDRLLFIGLWSYVDDNGVGRDNEKLILAALFPLEEDPRETLATVSRGLSNLFEAGLITRYSVDGTPLLHISAWDKHQRIDKPNKARHEPPTCGNAVIRETLAESSRHSRETPAPGAGNRGTGEQGTEDQGTREQTLSSDKSDHTHPDPLARFNEFWDTYGNKVGRAKSETAYKAALRKPGVNDDVLIASAAAYVLWCQETDTFQKNPLTWLHGEHWRDELKRVQRAPQQTNVQAHLALVSRMAEQERGDQLPLGQIGGAS